MEFNSELFRRVVSYIDLDCARIQLQRLLGQFPPKSREFQIVKAIIAHSKELYAALHAPFPALTERKCAALSCDTSAKGAVARDRADTVQDIEAQRPIQAEVN